MGRKTITLSISQSAYLRDCSPEDIERFREEMVKHQPHLAAAAQKAAAMVSTSEAGAKPPRVDAGSKVPSSDVTATVNGETVAAESICDSAVSDSAGCASAETEGQSYDQDLTMKELD